MVSKCSGFTSHSRQALGEAGKGTATCVTITELLPKGYMEKPLDSDARLKC